jgi:hypothetical protein
MNSKCHEANSGRQHYSFYQGMAEELTKMFLQQDGARPQPINTFLDILALWK